MRINHILYLSKHPSLWEGLGRLCVVGFMGFLFLVSSCVNNDEETDPLILPGSEPPPAWTVSASLYTKFEYTMSVQVVMQQELLPYVSDDDLMCAVVDGEIRAVSTLYRTGSQPYFCLAIAGEGSGAMVSLRYYCSQLKRIYTATDWLPFTPSMPPTQNGKPYILKFTAPWPPISSF